MMQFANIGCNETVVEKMLGGGRCGAGTPFNIRVTSRTDASKVRVSGPGLQAGLLATFQSDLLVETSGAGPGRLTVRVRGPKGLTTCMFCQCQSD